MLTSHALPWIDVDSRQWNDEVLAEAGVDGPPMTSRASDLIDDLVLLTEEALRAWERRVLAEVGVARSPHDVEDIDITGEWPDLPDADYTDAYSNMGAGEYTEAATIDD